MSVWEILITAVALSMDAFAVSVCKGLAFKKINFKKALIVGLWFGGFQALMPLIGYYLGSTFSNLITAFDHWIAFALLSVIGINMIRESLSTNNEKENSSLSFKTMIVLALATSIDALAVGVTFAFLNVQIYIAILIIGIITLVLSMLGVKIGNVFGAKFKNKAEFAGGIILILIGVKILLEHTGVINF